MLHVVVETPSYLSDAKAAGLSAAEQHAIVDYLSANPDAGTLIPGTGGARKLRFPGKGRGKSGGYRVVTFYSGQEIPVFLLAVLSKGERADLSQKERNELRRILGEMVAEYKKGDRKR